MRWAGLDVPVRSRCRPVESSSAAFIRDLNTRDGLTRDARECGAPVFREIFHVLVYVCAYVCVCVLDGTALRRCVPVCAAGRRSSSVSHGAAAVLAGTASFNTQQPHVYVCIRMKRSTIYRRREMTRSSAGNAAALRAHSALMAARRLVVTERAPTSTCIHTRVTSAVDW